MAGINGTDERRGLEVPLERLQLEGGRTLTWFKDGPDGKSLVAGPEAALPEGTGSLRADCLPRGGFVAIIR